MCGVTLKAQSSQERRRNLSGSILSSEDKPKSSVRQHGRSSWRSVVHSELECSDRERQQVREQQSLDTRRSSLTASHHSVSERRAMHRMLVSVRQALFLLSLSLSLSLSFVLLIDEMRMVNVIGRSPSLFPVFVCVLMRLTETTRVLEAEECTSSSRTCLSTSQQSTTTPRRTACLSLRHLIVMENSAMTEQSSNH